ncbi:GNAT family N-acetyltransferase [Pseudomonas putida CSV86]|uniref:GNAT family N-acetyltransferase n=1 Tax=Pseudomonas bharatica CSV86 TaxID=1005395 RepID=L1M8I4_9PSED|nr:GNAT family N-acetyltransferase [Pseudomonas bharatica]NNJ14387.1 GNAT family N-acetyltransferase [Pseudomonas bharatica CSV86]
MNLQSKTVKLRLVEENDAEFILRLRTDSKYNQHLSQVTGGVAEQVEWIRRYKNDEKNKLQYYFIIERNDGVRCGTLRVYDIRPDSFSWGSWILNEDKTRFAAIESAFLVYRFGFDHLKFEKSHFEVRKENTKVISFHEKMGAVRNGETELDFLYEISKPSVLAAQEKLLGKLL